MMSNSKTLMIQGTSSSAGKSLLVTALCRIFARKGVRVAPFKAQNMSNNAAVCPDGSEIGRAQAVQASAAGLVPTVDMNPILIKPEADARSQMIVMGKPWKRLDARDYFPQKTYLWETVKSALNRLRSEYDLVLIEGAGSPVEMNLKENDIVNMAVARYARSPVLLVGDIDRGGIFSQLLGTYWLLPQEEQELLAGFVINKFRGDIALFKEGPEIIEERSGRPVFGVVPYLPNLLIPEEDSVALQDLKPVPPIQKYQTEIAVIHLPRISNFDDFMPLQGESGIQVRYVQNRDQLGDPDAIILPGTKSTLADLNWLWKTGLSERIISFAASGGSVVGICGGYQMLGKIVEDPGRLESSQKSQNGLDLLPVSTRFNVNKQTYQARGQVISNAGWMQAVNGLEINGYEIHQGQSRGTGSWLEINQRNGEPVKVLDGSISPDGNVWGSYFHGLFENILFRRAWLHSLGANLQDNYQTAGDPFRSSLALLADTVESSLNMKSIEELLWEN